MYSLVLMMAMSSGAGAPALGHKGHDCCGCYGNYSYTCHGYSCSGGYACHGGCYGNDCNGCGGRRHHRRDRGCCGCCAPVVYTSCCGCWGGHPAVAPAPAKMPAPPAKGEKLSVPPKSDAKVQAFAPAVIIVSLPAEAKLSIDGTTTASQTATRVFSSPALESGKDFYYSLTAELVRDGRTVTSTEKVKVRAGEETRVKLEFATPMTVAQR